MRRILSGFIAYSLIAALQVFAGQAEPPLPMAPVTNDATGEGNIIGELNKRYREASRGQGLEQRAEGIGVAPQMAMLCKICNQPLYKHSDPSFECIPVDEDGNPKPLLRVITRQAQCPVCAAKFTAALHGHVNTKAGMDRDFCSHSIGKYSIHSNVWICPDCGYAGLIDGFGLGLDGKELDEQTKAFVREKLAEAMRKRMIEMVGLAQKNNKPIPEEYLKFSKYVLQTEIPDWLKYDHALQIYERVKPPHALLAGLYLEAAHSCRREVCKELSVSRLDQGLQVSLGKTIRRMNSMVQLECMNVRRRHGAPAVDANIAETDAAIMEEAAAGIIRQGDDALAKARANPAAGEIYFSPSDMFVLGLQYAGVLDRLGKLEEAGKALQKCVSYVPESLPADEQEPAAVQEWYNKQLKLLRGVVDERVECLNRERGYLFKAATQNMFAIHLNEISFKDYKANPLAPDDKKLSDPAPFSYLLGELMRRVDEPGDANAWFAAADQIISRNLELVDKAAKPPAQNGANGAAPDVATALHDRLATLKQWCAEQRATVKKTGPADEKTQAVIAMVLASAGLQPSPPSAAAVPPSPAQPVALANAAPNPALPAAVNTGGIKTREELYKLYYAALMSYRADKKENPPKLKELVTAGFVPPDSSNLDANGKLVCPETKEWLGYSRNWTPGDAATAVLFSVSKPGSKALYADGKIR